MKIVLDARKTVEEAAASYFERAKKARKKLEGAKAALLQLQTKLSAAKSAEHAESTALKAVREKELAASARYISKRWYEKFHWFISSEGFLCVGGRDATSNEVLIKKHTEPSDMVFHTDLSGSPFFVIKAESNPKTKIIGKESITEAASATVAYSRAWRAGIQSAEVYSVKPEQVSKKTVQGEYMGRGAFMIYGKRSYVPALADIAVGVTKNGKIMTGPHSAVSKHSTRTVKIVQGKLKSSDAAKKLAKILRLDLTYLDELVRSLPAGGCEVAS